MNEHEIIDQLVKDDHPHSKALLVLIQKQNTIHEEIVGNKAFGRIGLIRRVSRLEKGSIIFVIAAILLSGIMTLEGARGLVDLVMKLMK